MMIFISPLQHDCNLRGSCFPGNAETLVHLLAVAAQSVMDTKVLEYCGVNTFSSYKPWRLHYCDAATQVHAIISETGCR